MKRRLKGTLVCLASFAATLALAPAQNVEAASRRVHASACHGEYDAYGGNVTRGIAPDTANTGDLINGTHLDIRPGAYNASYQVFCPAPSDSTLAHSITTTLNVHGYRGTTLFGTDSSAACVKFFNAGGGSCGTAKSWAANWGGALGVSTAAWSANFGGMPYVLNDLHRGSRFYGFYMSN